MLKHDHAITVTLPAGTYDQHQTTLRLNPGCQRAMHLYAVYCVEVDDETTLIQRPNNEAKLVSITWLSPRWIDMISPRRRGARDEVCYGSRVKIILVVQKRVP